MSRQGPGNLCGPSDPAANHQRTLGRKVSLCPVLGEAATVDVDIFSIHLQLEPGDRLQIGLSIARKDPLVAHETIALLPQTRVLLPRETGRRTPVA